MVSHFQAPKDHRIRVTISLWMTRQGLSTRVIYTTVLRSVLLVLKFLLVNNFKQFQLCHKSCTNFGVEIADGDLTYTGKKFALFYRK